MSNLLRYIRDNRGAKVESKTRSVNITIEHHEFLEREKLNLSAIIRDVLDGLLSEKLNKKFLKRGSK